LAGIFAKLHFAGIAFPGVSILAIGSFVLSATSNDLTRDQNGVVIGSVIAILAVEVTLTAVIVVTMWRIQWLLHRDEVG
jgi:hypothetical protein